MKKHLITPLALVLGLTTIAEPGFAMRSNRPGYTPDQINSVVSTMLVVGKWLLADQPHASENSEDNDPFLGNPTTFVSQSGTHFEVSGNVLSALTQLAPTIAYLLSDLEGTDIATIPLNLVNDPALYLLIQMASRDDHESLLDFIRNLSADEVKKLKDDAQFLDSRALKNLISRAFDNPFTMLPNEILLELFSRVGPRGRTFCWSVNRAFREFLNGLQGPLARGGMGWTDTLPLVTTIAVGKYPRTPVIVGEMLYVMNHGDLTVSVIDTYSHQVVATIPIGGVLPVAHGQLLYLASIHNSALYISDANRNQKVATLEIGIQMPSSMIHGQMRYLPDSLHSAIRVIDTDTNKVVAILKVGEAPQLPVIHGQMIYVVNWGSSTVSVFDIGGY